MTHKKILIHALSLREHGGTARHLRSFLPSLSAYSPSVQYVLCVNADFAVPGEYSNIRILRIPIRADMRRVWWDQVMLPKVARLELVDAIWCLLGFGSMRPSVPQITFQRAPTYYCRWHLQTLKGRERFETLVRRWLQLKAMQASRCIVTPTNSMRDMILSIYPKLPSEKFKTIPHAFDSQGLEATEPLPLAVQKTLADCSGEALTVLYVGHILPYKELDVLLEAFQLVTQSIHRPVRLVLTIAREDWPKGYDAFVRQVKTRGLERKVKILGKIPQLAIGHLYRACDVVAFPSLCESFGWPLVEATSLGIPVLAADTPVNREMAGEGALYFAPRDVTSVAEQLQKLLEDEQLRAMVGAAGGAHFERTHLTWPEYVQRCLEATFGSKARDNRDSP